MTEKKTVQCKLSFQSSLLLGTYCIIACLLIWQSIRPFLAERHFRDGYYLEKKGYSKFSIIEQEKAVRYANWEPHYKLHLGKAYEAHARKSKRNKEAYYLNALEVYKKMILQDPKSYLDIL